MKDFKLDLSQSILVPIADKDVLSKIIDPTTDKPYNGIIFTGEFASLNVLNNNNRIYTPENYIPLIEQMRKVIFGSRGLYGSLEHKTGYASNYNEISHKILDIWYDEKTQKVFGKIMLLNTPTGLMAQEIYRSGGRFAISGRGGGTERQNSDGSITAILKLLVTFDVVYHPGFTTAEQIGCTLMESIKNYSNENMSPLFENYVADFEGFGIGVKKDDNIEEINPLFESFKSLHEFGFGFKTQHDYRRHLNDTLFESEKDKQDSDIQKMESGEVPNQQKAEDELGDAVDDELKESQFRKKQSKGFNKLAASVYDDSAGFVTEGL